MKKDDALLLESLLEMNKRQAEMIETQAKQIRHLEERIDYLTRQRFTSSSEKSLTNQPSLFDALASETLPIKEDTEVEQVTVVRKRRGGRTTPPESLPHVRVEHDLKEEEKVCSCGCEMRRITEEVSHQYDIIPASFRVIRNVRFVYACSCGCGAKLKTSPLSPQVLPRHQVTPSFLATIAVQKFEDALPLERQARIYKKRFGVAFTSSTFSDWMIKTSQSRLEPVMERLKAHLLQSTYVQADETTLQVLREPGRKASQKSYIWLRVNQDGYPIVLMHYSANRAGSTASSLFKGFKGYLQTDGYPGYNAVANPEGVTQLGCWAHARRRFADIVKSGVSDEESKAYARKAVAMVAKLYKIEKEIKEHPPDEKYRVREEKARPIVNEIREWLDTHFFTVQGLGGAIAKAFVYLNNQFEKLSVYLEDGRLSIDNNDAERHVRPIALGRKNWMFATSTKGATALANWYSVIETAKANDLEPFAYLKHLLTQLPIYEQEGKDIDPLLPWNVSLG